ncbi:MAG: hypothetical protein N3B21_07575 [Clostridia bacterium]|nr:hypothetical protein [Clostridia bacterium]
MMIEKHSDKSKKNIKPVKIMRLADFSGCLKIPLVSCPYRANACHPFYGWS